MENSNHIPTRFQMGVQITRLTNKVYDLEFQIDLIKELHTEKYKDITGTPVCQECDQYMPCDTLIALTKKRGVPDEVD